MRYDTNTKSSGKCFMVLCERRASARTPFITSHHIQDDYDTCTHISHKRRQRHKLRSCIVQCSLFINHMQIFIVFHFVVLVNCRCCCCCHVVIIITASFPRSSCSLNFDLCGKICSTHTRPTRGCLCVRVRLFDWKRLHLFRNGTTIK